MEIVIMSKRKQPEVLLKQPRPSKGLQQVREAHTLGETKVSPYK